jgi:hypothetical protein
MHAYRMPPISAGVPFRKERANTPPSPPPVTAAFAFNRFGSYRFPRT